MVKKMNGGGGEGHAGEAVGGPLVPTGDKCEKLTFNYKISMEYGAYLLAGIGIMLLILNVMEIVNYNKMNVDNDNTQSKNLVYGMLATKGIASIMLIIIGFMFKNLQLSKNYMWGYIGALVLYFIVSMIQLTVLWGGVGDLEGKKTTPVAPILTPPKTATTSGEVVKKS
jgi:hypothetical protein